MNTASRTKILFDMIAINRTVCVVCALTCLGAFYALLNDTLAKGQRPPEDQALSGELEYRTENGRAVYFGDLHVHTVFSLDAFLRGTRNSPSAAYRFARGEAIQLEDGLTHQLDRPLDFAAVTDHAEWFGEVLTCWERKDDIYESEFCTNLRSAHRIRESTHNVYDVLIPAFIKQQPPQHIPEVCEGNANGLNDRCAKRALTVWGEIQRISNSFYDPGNFTTFIGYEWTGMGSDFSMYHRNVIFRDHNVPAVIASSIEAPEPYLLWQWMEKACVNECKAIAIPHNPNWSWGTMFEAGPDFGSPYNLPKLAAQKRLEPLIEIHQIKGNSECYFGLGTNDELCSFEHVWNPCTDTETANCALARNYIRNGLKQGLMIEEGVGLNPYQMGFIGSTDTHNATAGATSESGYSNGIIGWHGVNDDAPQERLDLESWVLEGPARISSYNPGGLTGVWAEQNTRESIFAALVRREVFATSGPRMQIRFFASWHLNALKLGDPDVINNAYANGVPMGGVLVNPPGGSQPHFLVWAVRDLKSAGLEKIQIVKGWLEDGSTKEKVYDVICSSSARPDPETNRCPGTTEHFPDTNCEEKVKKGENELKAIWIDPDFNRDQRAFYYVRVLEMPTCRWSVYDAASINKTHPEYLPETIRERAWSSPIWYQPE